MAQKLRVRRSIHEIYNDFKSGKDTVTLEKLIVAWQFIKALPASDPNSFMTLGGFHGEPFVGRGAYDGNYWGGYCNHGNILFPTWHRVYLHKVEKALQSVPGCEDVTLPYWDQTYKITDTHGKQTYLGVPSILTDEYFTFKDGVTIPNPLRSFILPEALQDDAEVNFYSKPKGYETVRYPLSGLVGRPADRAASELNNSAYFIPGTNVIDHNLTTTLLNSNVQGWLDGSVKIPGGFNPASPPVPVEDFRGGIYEQYKLSLEAPYYVVFSNNTSRTEWNSIPGNTHAQAVESPHGSVHLAVGGINAPGQDADSASSLPFLPADANGDMGENETAGLDPIFFFHHCNMDRIFWKWQTMNCATDLLDLKVKNQSGIPPADPYPGTNNGGPNQQPPVGYEPHEQLTMDSPLYPFKLVMDGVERYFRSSDVFNIEKQLFIKYDNLSLDNSDQKSGASEDAEDVKLNIKPHKSKLSLTVSGINRAKINGSFVIMAYATIDGTRHFLGSEPVLSRWKVVACRNCMTHLDVSANFPLYEFTSHEIARAIFEIQINGRKSNEAEFAKFAVANQANVKKFISSRSNGNLKIDNTIAEVDFHKPIITGNGAFNLEVK